jgi:hypothetical protein
VAIEQTSKFAVARLCDEAARRTACQSRRGGADHGPLQAPHDPDRSSHHGRHRSEPDGEGHPVRPKQPRNRGTILSRLSRFNIICQANEVEHRLTEPNHSWANGQVERMSRTIGDATTKRYHYESHEQKAHLELCSDTYNHARRLKTLKDLTPAQLIWMECQSKSELFNREPCQMMAGLNSFGDRHPWP